MHTKSIALLLLLTSVCTASAGFKMPKSVHRADDIEAAQTEAKAKGRALTFILTNEATSCPLCENASLDAVDELDNDSEVVYVTTQEYGKLPPIVREAMSSKEAGGYIPKTVVTDAEITKVIAIVPYSKGSTFKKALNDAEDKIEELQPEQSRGRTPAAVPAAVLGLPEDENREMRTWTARNGDTLTASLVKEDWRYVVLKKEDGSQLRVLSGNLSPMDRAYVNRLKTAGQ